jgi:hypothetical protein
MYRNRGLLFCDPLHLPFAHAIGQCTACCQSEPPKRSPWFYPKGCHKEASAADYTPGQRGCQVIRQALPLTCLTCQSLIGVIRWVSCLRTVPRP